MSVPIHSIDQAKFQELVAKKRAISLTLSICMLCIYFGFILVLAFRKELLSAKIGEHLTAGVPVGLLVILSACILTGIYVSWANSTYDDAVKDIIARMKEKTR